MSLPAIVSYRGIKPQGFPQQYKQLIVNPQMSFTDFKTDQLVRYTLNTDGWIDPFKSYIEFEIEVDEDDFTSGCIELDGPSSSLISEMIISQNNRILERIREYDQIGVILSDINYASETRTQRKYEGIEPDVNTSFQQGHFRQYQIYNNLTHFQSFSSGYMGPSNMLPTKVTSVSFVEPYTEEQQKMIIQITAPNHMPQKLIYNHPEFMDLYTPYYAADSSLNGTYGIQGSQSYNYQYQNAEPSQCHQFGYQCPYGPGISDGNRNCQLFHASKALKIVNGKFYDNPDPNYSHESIQNICKRTLLVPFLSGIFGVLIPENEYKLIPGSALTNLLIEIQLNPNAFFTSGYLTTNYNSSAQMIRRSWKIKNIQLKFDMWYFDSQTTSALNSMLTNGLTLNSQQFSLGPMYQIQSGAHVTNTWQINNGIPSANILFFWFLDDSYKNFTYCRKNYRLSQNVTSIQIKVGADYIPPYPITGHAGNIAKNRQIPQDNNQFVTTLHKAINKFFNIQSRTTINSVAFAVNQRPYIPGHVQENENGNSANQFMFHEHRCRGKALYAVSLDQNPHDPNVISGFDTTKKRPIELILKNDGEHIFEGNSTMYTAFYHDFVVTFRPGEVTTWGQG